MCLTLLRRCTQTRADGATRVVQKHVGRRQLSPRCALAEQRVEDVMLREQAAPAWSRAGEWAVLEAASSSTRGSQSCQSLPELRGAPRGGTGAELRHCQGGTLSMLLLVGRAPRVSSSGGTALVRASWERSASGDSASPVSESMLTSLPAPVPVRAPRWSASQTSSCVLRR